MPLSSYALHCSQFPGGRIKLKTVALLAWIAILFASGLFLLRGPLRASSGYVNDFAAPYTATRLWLQHRNPYDATAFLLTWHDAGAPKGKVAGNPSGTHPVYPPPTLVVLIPFALMPWPIAVKALILLSTALYIAVLPLLASFLPGTWRDPIKPIFLAFGLALAPTHSGLHVTNVACLAATLLFFAIYFLLKNTEKQTNLPAIVCLTLSFCLKPTLGLLLIPYLLWTRAWRTLATTVALSAAITAASLYPLLSLGSVWLSSLRENIAVVFTNGGAADVSEQSLTRFDRIDLQLPLYALLHNRTAASVLTVLIAATLLLFWFKSNPHVQNQPRSSASLDQHILQIAALLLIGLIPFYQRYYSAMIVLLPVLWALRTFSQPSSRTTRRLVLVLSSLFLINTEAIFTRFLLPSLTVRFHLLTNFILGPHLCWLLLLLATLLLTAVLRQPFHLCPNEARRQNAVITTETLSVT